MVGVLGPEDDLQDFIEEWVVIASNAALELVETSYPELQLIPLGEDETQQSA